MAAKFLVVILLILYGVTGDQLKQVVVIGRHNIRSPLRNLTKYTQKEWTKWSRELSCLTTKGGLLEEYLGEYFSDWLVNEKLLTTECPNDTSVHVYANAPERTRKTAEHFIRSAFKGCNITINVMKNVTMDPLFLPIFHKPSPNNSKNFEINIRKEMQAKLDSVKLEDAYVRLNTILDFKNSNLCKEEGKCDLTKEKSVINLQYEKEPEVVGALKMASDVVDGFLMAYYDGVDLNKIGWGEIAQEDWKILGKVIQENQNVRFNYTQFARHVAKPLLNYIKKEFLEEKHKFTLLVGHDSNINTVLASIAIKPYDLESQNEKSPIGGKIVFEKWLAEDNNRHFLKIKFVYLTAEQIRNGARITKENPPRTVILEMQNCTIDNRGYCPFEKFLEIL